MTDDKRPRWSLKRMFAERVDARIEQALAVFSLEVEARTQQAIDEAIARLGAELAAQIETRSLQATNDAIVSSAADFTPRIEARGRQATDEAVARFQADLCPQLEARGRRATDEAVTKMGRDFTEKMVGELTELCHRIEVRAQLATAEAISQSGRSMTYDLEVRAQAITQELQVQAAHEAEAKTQMAGLDAKSYADAGLLALSKAIAATGKVMAQLSNRLDALEKAAVDAPARMTETPAGLRDGNGTGSGRAPELPSGLQSGAAAALTKTLERIDDVIARQAAVMARAKSTRAAGGGPAEPNDMDEKS